ncbi:cohesin complex subunit [Kickxella alabastrina]|uniref:Cohesin complex subunit n=1 Tax=Kickxella alabastrina TaxID=61397 RepID=A0ACC1IQC2_9FUNG|nr:cohesin complex subunit [Kickxella alabastrina]
MATPTRRSARVTRAPERLTASIPVPTSSPLTTTATTPRKRTKASAFASPLPAQQPPAASSRSKSKSKSKSKNKKRQRTARTTQRIATASDSEQESGQESEQESEQADSDDDNSDFEEKQRAVAKKAPRTPQGSRKTTKQKAEGRAQQQHQQHQQSAMAAATDALPSELFNAVLDDNVAVAQVVSDWIEAYRADDEASTGELINFLIKLAGCPGQIPHGAVYETEGITEQLERLQTQSIAALKHSTNTSTSSTAASEELLLGKSKEHRRQRKQALDFVQRLIIDGQHHLVFAHVNEDNGLSPFTEVLLQWLVAMAASAYRPFRHAATLASLAVQSALVSVRAHTAQQLQTTQRQLESGSRVRADAQQRLRDRIGALGEQDEAAEAAFKAIYDTVFIYRYRDVHAVIRAECLVPLASWCRALPAAYLATEYLRYLGWSLNDKDARVREAALAAALGPLLTGKALGMAGAVGAGVGAVGAADSAAADVISGGFRPFIVRFLPRLVQMAAGDVDTKVQVAALKLFAQLARLGYLDPDADLSGAPAKQTRQRKRGDGGGGGRRKKAGKRGTYSHSLSQQLLEESDSSDSSSSGGGGGSEAEQPREHAEGAAQPGAAGPLAGIQPLYADAGGGDLGACPRHSVLRLLAPLVAHTHVTVRAAAAELVAWWLRDAWAGRGGGSREAGGVEHTRELLRCLGAFLHRLALMSHPAAGEAAREHSRWVAEQAAASVEELWSAPPAAAAGLGSDEHQLLQAAAAGGPPPTALDGAIEAAVCAGAGAGAVQPRVAAAAQALWHKMPELGAALGTLAEMLGHDHSALPPAEECALLQALAVWVCERQRAVRARRLRTHRTADADAEQPEAALWQALFAPLVARNMDDAQRLLPLVFLAAEALDAQQLFDAERTDVLQALARMHLAIIARHSGHVRVVRLAAAFLERLDASRLLAATADGDLVGAAAGAAVERLFAGGAVAYAHLVPVRALIRRRDISARLPAVGALLAAARSADPLLALAALDTALHCVLWRALRVDSLLGAAASGSPLGAQATEAVRQLCGDRDSLAATCLALVSDESACGRVREMAFAVAGRVLRLFTGPLASAPGGAELRRQLVLPLSVEPVRAQLERFFARRMAAWHEQLADCAQASSPSICALAPSAWAIGYARVCALGALWAQWLGDHTVAPTALALVAAYTGIAGLEAAERQQPAGARRSAGFVALSAFDHLVQAAVDALRPQLLLQSSRAAAMDALLGAVAACDARSGAAGPVNVATLGRFVGAALRSAFAAQQPAAPALARTPGRGSDATTLAPPAIGLAWSQRLERAVAAKTGMAQMLDAEGELRMEPLAAAEWAPMAAWFAALAQTIHGVVRPRHAMALDAQIRRLAGEAPIAAVAPYQRALSRELAKAGAISARLEEARAGVGLAARESMLSMSPTPTPMPRRIAARDKRGNGDDAMDVDA